MIPKKILSAYDLGRITKIKRVTDGLIHETYQIKSRKGTFILQKLHPVLSSSAIASDFYKVTEFLSENKFSAPKCVLTKKGEILFKNGKDKWRAQTFIPGKTFHKLEKVSMAKEAGKMYGRFHKVMDDYPYAFKSKKILHETEKIYKEFLKVMREHRRSPLMIEVAQEVQLVMKELPKFFLPKTLPLRAIHGDPKISNIRFDSRGKAKGIIDLDTCNRRPLLVELGDAFRSWCGVEEDDANNHLRLQMFKAGWQGYYSEAKDFILSIEKKQVAKSIGTITLELTARFLKDYFEDKYFGWDETRYDSRRDHNLARARGQLALFKDYKKKIKEIKKIIG